MNLKTKCSYQSQREHNLGPSAENLAELSYEYYGDIYFENLKTNVLFKFAIPTMCFMDADTQGIHSLFSLAESGRAKQTANFMGSLAPNLLQNHQFLFLMFLSLPIKPTSLID
jgi:hypothetical protein